jgi:hypothetical protein
MRQGRAHAAPRRAALGRTTGTAHSSGSTSAATPSARASRSWWVKARPPLLSALEHPVSTQDHRRLYDAACALVWLVCFTAAALARCAIGMRCITAC